MLNFWTTGQKYREFRQLIAVVLVFGSGLAQGQVVARNYVAREPASYIPDDDVIVKPVDNELSFYQRYVASDNSNEVVQSRNQLKVWSDNQIFAEQHGMDTSLAGAPYYVPSQAEKLEFFKNRYMRYLRQKGETPLRDVPQTWYNNFRASNEVDTIDELEARFKKTHSKTSTGRALPDALKEKEVSLWKETKIIFQPRIEQGLAVVGIRGPIAYARAWVGVNGRTELNIQKNIDSIGFRLMWNYHTNSGKYFTTLDQRVADHLYLRITSMANPGVKATSTNNLAPTAATHDNTFMLLYTRQF